MFSLPHYLIAALLQLTETEERHFSSSAARKTISAAKNRSLYAGISSQVVSCICFMSGEGSTVWNLCLIV